MKVMEKNMEYVDAQYKKSCSIGLFANTRLEKFYSRFGFIKRKDDIPGMQIRVK